jgi:transposase-like protein
MMLPQDLPGDLPSFLARFGTDEQCREYLFRARWPEGFHCAGCGHHRAWGHKARLIYECTVCGKQHSLLAGTIFEQTKTGLARWFLAIYLVTSSKGGISAMELKRQMGFGSYQTAWTWLHKIRRAMVRPERERLSKSVEVDETYVGGPKPGKPGRGAAGKTKVAGAVESGRGKARGRRLGRLRLAVVPDVSARSLEDFLGRNVAKPTTITTDGWSGYAGLDAAGYGHEPLNLSATWGDAALRLPAIHLVFGLAKRWLLGTHHGAVGKKHLGAYLDEFVFRLYGAMSVKG